MVSMATKDKKKKNRLMKQNIIHGHTIPSLKQNIKRSQIINQQEPERC